MKVKASEFIKWIESKVGCPYMWGGQGETVYGLIKSLAKKKGMSDDAINRMLFFLERHGTADAEFFDCSGLGVQYLLDMGALTSDTTAQGLRNRCEEIERYQLRPSDMAFFVDEDNKATHVGYIVSDGSVVHALDYSHGTIKEKIDDRKEWNWFGRPSKLIEYDLTIDEFIDVTQLKKDDVITVSKPLKGYTTAINAIYEQNPKTTCSPGEYFVYKVYRKSVNITKKKGKPGSWVVL